MGDLSGIAMGGSIHKDGEPTCGMLVMSSTTRLSDEA